MRLFTDLSRTSKIMIASASVICGILLILGLIVTNFIYPFEQSRPYAAGIIIGYVHSVLKLIMIEKSLNSVMNTDGNKGRAENIGRLFYLLRFVFTGAVLAFAFIFPKICGPFGAIFGVLSLQISAYTANIFLTKSENKDNAGIDGEEDGEDEEDVIEIEDNGTDKI